MAGSIAVIILAGFPQRASVATLVLNIRLQLDGMSDVVDLAVVVSETE